MAKDPSKTEKATPKRRDKAREKGSVPRSSELAKFTVLFMGLIVMRLTIGTLGNQLEEVFTLFLGRRLHFEPTPDALNALFWMLTGRLALMLLPLLCVIAAVAYLTQRLQVGSIWHSKLFSPDFSNLFNPIGALQKLLINPKTVIQLSKQVLTAGAIAIAPYLILRHKFNEFFPLFYQTPENIAAFLLENGFTMVIYTMVPMVIISIADVWYTRWDYEEELKMTKDEVKDETKQAIGDPAVKAQQKRKMMEVVQKRMLQDVPRADVVITNPTHLACALRYDPLESPAPTLLAKGADYLAEKIKEIAREHHIPIRENKPLAQALYKNVEIGQTIPEDLYQAVASILAQLDKFKRPGRPR